MQLKTYYRKLLINDSDLIDGYQTHKVLRVGYRLESDMFQEAEITAGVPGSDGS